MARWGCEEGVIIRVMAILGSWRHLGPSWGHLGAILGRSWAHLGAILAHLGPSWVHLGAILGRSWGPGGPSWAHLGPILGLSWAFWSHVVPILGHSAAPFVFSPKVKTIRSCAPGPSASFLNLGLCCRYPWAFSLNRPRSPDSSASRSAGCFRFPLVLLSLLL